MLSTSFQLVQRQAESQTGYRSDQPGSHVSANHSPFYEAGRSLTVLLVTPTHSLWYGKPPKYRNCRIREIRASDFLKARSRFRTVFAHQDTESAELSWNTSSQ